MEKLTGQSVTGIVRSLLSFSLGLLLQITIACTAAADGEQAAQVKRSTIQAVDGYAYLAEDKTLSQLREAALNNAKQLALANATTFIRSRTEVENFVLKSDSVLLNAEGTVKILEQRDEGITDNSRYHIWIRAEVEYLLPGDTPGEVVAREEQPARQERKGDEPGRVDRELPSSGGDGPLTVRVWSERQHYTAGEKIQVKLRGNRDFYARIVDINSAGQIVQLLPNAYRPSRKFEGGRVYTIPGEGDRFDLTVSPPFGTDKIVVYASDAPLGEVDLVPAGQGLGLYRGEPETLAMRTRGIAVTPRTVDQTERRDGRQENNSIAEFIEASYEIETGP